MRSFRYLVGACVLQMMVIFFPLAYDAYLRSFGEEVWLEMRLYDPRDMLRGHYLRISSAQSALKLMPSWCEYGKMPKKAYLVLKKDVQGQAMFTELSDEKPEGLFLTVIPEHRYCQGDDTWPIELPFQRYYMNENRAQDIERERSLQEETLFHLQLFIKDGAYSLGALEPKP
ncbi:MAG: GDYXXLXY domain-containing protein [Cardiobacteriaceae bacterium]|nr:GDYXXLXY domain-containing protein [Cardiobacteriaceae bacterium]